MSFTDRSTSILISDESLRDGTWQWLDETPGISPDGWDTLSVKYVKYSPTFLTGESAGLDFATGSKLADRNFWAQGIAGPNCMGGLLYVITVTYKGFAATQPAVLSYSTAAEQQQGENILTPDGLFARVATSQNVPTVNVRYILPDINNSLTGSVGSELEPPSPLSTPPSVWDFLTQFTYNWPNGWVLMGSNPTPLPGTTVALVSDDYQHIQAITP